MKICDTHRKKLRKESLDATESIISVHKLQNLILCSVMVQKQYLHLKCLAEIGEAPFSKSRAKTVYRK